MSSTRRVSYEVQVGVIVAAGMAYVVGLGWAMANLSYDLWGALVAVPLIALVMVPLVARIFRSDRTIARVAYAGLALKLGGTIARYWVAFDAYGGEAGAEVVFTDASLAYGTTDLSVQVSKMKDAGVDMVITCIDTNGMVTLAKELKKQELDATQFLPNGYDPNLMAEFGDLFEGAFIYLSFAPLESEPQPEGLALYLEWMEETGGTISENSLVGWLNADLFVRGLEAAGPDFSQDSVVDAINSMDDYVADGLLPGVDWTDGHTTRRPINCNAALRVEDGEFVPYVKEEGTIFTCFDLADDNLEPTFQ